MSILPSQDDRQWPTWLENFRPQGLFGDKGQWWRFRRPPFHPDPKFTARWQKAAEEQWAYPIDSIEFAAEALGRKLGQQRKLVKGGPVYDQQEGERVLAQAVSAADQSAAGGQNHPKPKHGDRFPWDTTGEEPQKEKRQRPAPRFGRGIDDEALEDRLDSRTPFSPTNGRLVLGFPGADLKKEGDGYSLRGDNPEFEKLIEAQGGYVLPHQDLNNLSDQIAGVFKENPDTELYLAGYSRGGNFAAQVANRLGDYNVPVKGVLGLDPHSFQADRKDDQGNNVRLPIDITNPNVERILNFRQQDLQRNPLGHTPQSPFVGRDYASEHTTPHNVVYSPGSSVDQYIREDGTSFWRRSDIPATEAGRFFSRPVTHNTIVTTTKDEQEYADAINRFFNSENW